MPKTDDDEVPSFTASEDIEQLDDEQQQKDS